ncbi:S8/S53 family peptidase [Zoogloea sp.]|uniref:S8 family peptidase n=1 Tax=Zoogloea sp. TaxID=49181 RepID=UPI002620A49B|nr:S8/S53 family peptidase [Zoogloea sp.]
MAQPYYLVTGDPKKLAKIARYARKLTGKQQGDPVLAVGSHRIVLMPAAVSRMIESAPTQPITGFPPSFAEIMEGMKAEGATPINQGRLAELLATREPAELAGIPRAELDESDLVIDGWDWHLKRTRLVDAWGLVGSAERIDWKGLRVGQIDTGFREIPCLGFKGGQPSSFVLTDFDRNFFPGDFTRDPFQYVGNPFASEFSALDPMLGGANDGHGTRTASVLAGFDPSVDRPYFGAAPQLPFIPVRICDSVIINHVQGALALAIEHLVRHGCSVITLSMGMALTLIDDRLRKAIDYAYENGVILVAAAGNVWDLVVAPARLNRTLAVGGCTPALIPWIGSSFGPEVDLCAPAWPIRRASADRKGRQTYGYGDGTSFATPQVAATAALWLLYRGEEIRARYPQKWQRVEAFKTLVKDTASAGGDWNREQYGEGILDAYAALRADLPPADALREDKPA